MFPFSGQVLLEGGGGPPAPPLLENPAMDLYGCRVYLLKTRAITYLGHRHAINICITCTTLEKSLGCTDTQYVLAKHLFLKELLPFPSSYFQIFRKHRFDNSKASIDSPFVAFFIFSVTSISSSFKMSRIMFPI